MQQTSEHPPEFQGVDTRSWASFSRLVERWESAHGLDRSDMLHELLQGYLRGELWPTILPNVYGGTALTASPKRRKWMKSPRRWPIETFTRLDFLRAAKGFAKLHLNIQTKSITIDDMTGQIVDKKYANDPYAAGYRGLIGIELDKYGDFFIESYIKELTPPPNAVAHWCSGHGWPVPPGLSCFEQAPRAKRKRPAEQPHDRWVAMAAELRKANRKMPTSKISRIIHKEDFERKRKESKDEFSIGWVADSETIRRVLTTRKLEWDIPQES